MTGPLNGGELEYHFTISSNKLEIASIVLSTLARNFCTFSYAIILLQHAKIAFYHLLYRSYKVLKVFHKTRGYFLHCS